MLVLLNIIIISQNFKFLLKQLNLFKQYLFFIYSKLEYFTIVFFINKNIIKKQINNNSNNKVFYYSYKNNNFFIIIIFNPKI